MSDRGRRAFVLGAGGLLVGFAGCLEEGEEFLVTNTQLTTQGETDIRVRVTIENISDERRSGVLEVTLLYHGDGDTESAPDETWRQTETVTVKQAASPQLQYVFEGAYEQGRDLTSYTVEASIDEDEDEGE